jgi:hypothetical protein
MFRSRLSLVLLSTFLAVFSASSARAELTANWQVDAANTASDITAAVTTKSLTANVATVTCSAPHGFSVGEAVLVALSPVDPIFDGNYTISAVTPDSFSYAKTSANQAATAVAGTARQSFFGKTDRNRGMCYNPVTDHLLISRVAPGIQILSAQDGSGIGQLNMTGVEAAGALYLMKVRALSNGAIYACNLATNNKTQPLIIYRWASEAAAPVEVYRNGASDGSGLGTLIGPAMPAAGAATHRVGDAMDLLYNPGTGDVNIYMARGDAACNHVYQLHCLDGSAVDTVADITLAGATVATTTYGAIASPIDNKLINFSAGETAMYTVTGTAGASRVGLPAFMGSTWGSPPGYARSAVIGGEWFVGFRDTAIVQEPLQYRGRNAVMKVDPANGTFRIIGYTPTAARAWSNTNGTGDADFSPTSGVVFMMNSNNFIGSYNLPGAGTAKTFTNAGGDLRWQNPANWNGGALPTCNDDVTLDNSSVAGSYSVKISTGTATCRTLKVGYPGNTNQITLALTSNREGAYAPVFTPAAVGAINDLAVTGPYDTYDRDYGTNGYDNGGSFPRIRIDSVGATDTFQWSINGGSTWTSSTQPIVAGAWVEILNGIKIKFANSTGHKLNDYWDFRPNTSYMPLCVAGDATAADDLVIDQGGKLHLDMHAVAGDGVNNYGSGNTSRVKAGGALTYSWYRINGMTAFPATGAGAVTFEPGSTFAYDVFNQAGFGVQTAGRTLGNYQYLNSYAATKMTSYSASQDLTVTGDFLVGPGAGTTTFANATIRFAGNITNNGLGLSSISGATVGGVLFNGNTTIGGSSPFSFPNAFTVGAGSSLTLGNGDIVVPSAKTATVDGTLNTGAFTAQGGTGAAAVGKFAGGGKIIGSVKQFVSAAVNSYGVPLGTAAKATSITLDFTTAPSNGGSVTAAWTDGAPSSNGLPLADTDALQLTNLGTSGFWTVTAGDGLAGGQYAATVDAGSFAPISNIANIRLAKRADGASPWALDGTPGTNSGSLVVRTGMSGFSQFGIVGDSGQVPVGLTALSVE